ncbi:MAG: hypothetical protein WA783_23060 [Phormidesmis sp.]
MKASRKFFVLEQSVYLFVARGADVDGGAKVLAVALVFSLSLLTGNEVVLGQFGTVAIA